MDDHRIPSAMVAASVWLCALSASATGPVEDVRRATGVSGGLVVHVGCDDGRQTAALGQNDAFLVHGLDTDTEQIRAARQQLLAAGLYGRISVSRFDGRRLPYVDNLVNLLVVSEDEHQISERELERVLAPGGVLWKLRADAAVAEPNSLFRKPWPEEIDQWTHFLHDASGNAVARDRVVGPPRHVQWLAGPLWTRHHHADKGTDPTIRSVVSADGRLYYMIDTAGTSDMTVPANWQLAARDGFSGVLLWMRPLPIDGTDRRLERVWRGLIADGGLVFAPLGADRPLAAIDGATGDTVRTYAGTKGLQEVIKSQGTLYAVTRQDKVRALDADTGDSLWQWSPEAGDALTPLTLAATRDRVFIKTERGLCCLDGADGQVQWQVPLPGPKRSARLRYPHEKLLVHDGVVLCSFGGNDPTSLNRDAWEFLGSHPRVREYDGRLGAFAADDGRKLWQAPYYPGLESMPGEVYVSDGQVWLGPDFSSPRDLHTGEVLWTRPVLERLWTSGHHYRCYPGKATCRYVLTAKRGIELIDMTGREHGRNNWVRATCRVGVTPCNGLLYAPPHSCGCYMEAKLFGFWALAAERERKDEDISTKDEAGGTAEHASEADGEPNDRFEHGPAYGSDTVRPSPLPTRPPSWSTYRADAARSASVPASLPTPLTPAWTADLGGRLSGVTIGADKVYVAQIDRHTVVALDAADGRVTWRYTAGGRVDSPPTLHHNLVVFGAADGWVYCLRAVDGQLVWRFRAAPRTMHAVAHEQLESLWPVHGSVLVRDGLVYAAAGRSSYLDGGIYLYGLDPATGEVIHRARLADQHAGAFDLPADDEGDLDEERFSQNAIDRKTLEAADRSDAFSMHGALTDVMSADATSIYLRHVRLDRTLVPLEEPRPHLFSTTTLLDDTEHHRSYWVLGTGDFSRTPVAYPWIVPNSLAVPYGLLLAFDAQTVWGIRRGGSRDYKQGYALFAAPRSDPNGATGKLPDFRDRRAPRLTAHWTVELPLRPRALLRAGEQLLIGGLADLSPLPPPADDTGLLQVASHRDGQALQQVPLKASPVWDGMAAAEGCLYAALRDGTVVCLRSDAPR